MELFLRSLAGLVFGVLSGFDRVMFQGHLRSLYRTGGMAAYCHSQGVLFKEFKNHSLAVSEQLIDASLDVARNAGRPVEYLRSSGVSKEEHARAIARRDKIRAGLIAALTCVEPCTAMAVRGNPQTKKLEFRPEQRHCLHVYHYYQHPIFGFCYARLQTWFPFTVQIGINGREWLARQMDDAGLAYRRHDNCITWVEDVTRAQKLLSEQPRLAWPEALEEMRRRIHPLHEQMFERWPTSYYWSLKQSEWASDVLFRKASDLQRRYEPWLRFAMSTFDSCDVLRFLGKKVTADGTSGERVPSWVETEVLSDLSRRAEGVRIKHRLGSNSVKMYDKAGGQVLRIETTIHDPRQFKVYRAKEAAPDGPKDWLELRAGVADVERRAEVSQSANNRYAQALAATTHKKSLDEIVDGLSRSVREPGKTSARWVRGLNLLSPDDAALLAAIGRPEYAINGLRNRDVVASLWPTAASTEAEKKRRCACVTRLLRILRAHGLIRKVPRSHRYQVSTKGRDVLTAVHAARNASTEKLIELAA